MLRLADHDDHERARPVDALDAVELDVGGGGRAGDERDRAPLAGRFRQRCDGVGDAGDDRACLDAVQVGGRSSSGPLPGWRRFDLNDIEGVTVLEDSFEVDAEFEARARDYRRGILVVAVDR